MMEWIATTDRLPEVREAPYQIIAAAHKPMQGVCAGMAIRSFQWDWVIRSWPQNYIAWMPAPPHIEIAVPT